jgi:iron complex outermembrane receptor protein
MSGALCGSAGDQAMAQAQDTLPEIVVDAPTPIARPRPRPVVRAPAPPSATPRAARAAPAPPPVVDAPPPQRPIVADTFVPVTVVTASELQRTTGATLGDALFTQPGVIGSTFAAGASRPIIRGLDNARVRVQENGIGAMDVSTLSEDHMVPIDPLTTDKVEIVRGPATLRYGPQAIGGVVATSNNRIPDPMTPAGYSLVNKTAVDTVNGGFENATIVEGRAADFAVHADYAKRVASDYRIPGGTQANTAVNTDSMSIGGSYFFKNGYVGINVSHIDSIYGIPGIESAASQTRIDLQQTKISSKGEFRFDNAFIDTIRFWLGGSIYKHDERGLDGGVDRVAATFRNNEVEGRAEVQLVPRATSLGLLNTAFGVQAGHQNLGTSGEAGSLLAPSATTRAAAYLFNELNLTQTTRLQAAGRIGIVAVDGTAAMFPAGLLPNGNPVPEAALSRQFAPMSASIGVLQELPWGVIASLTGQYAERAPEAQELFSKGPHDASGTFEIGNPNLQKEAAASVEFGLRRAKGDFRFDFTAYHTRYSGFIFKRLTGNTCGDTFDTCIAGPGEELKQVAIEQRDANFTGVELGAQLDLAQVAGGTFGIDGQYDFVHARFSDGSAVPRIPPHRLGGGMFWRDGNWFARVSLLHAFAQNEIAAEETPTAGYNLLKAELTYNHKFKPTDFLKEITVGVVGTNLLNEDVRNNVSFKKDEVLLPGRGARFFTTVRF